MKKFLALVLSALLILGCLPAALAEETIYQEFFYPNITIRTQEYMEIETARDWMSDDLAIARFAVLLPIDLILAEATDIDMDQYQTKDAYVCRDIDGFLYLLLPNRQARNIMMMSYSPMGKIASFIQFPIDDIPTDAVLEDFMSNFCVQYCKVDPYMADYVIQSILDLQEK